MLEQYALCWTKCLDVGAVRAVLEEVFRCWSSALCVGGSVKMLEH